jgi:hypothetical protein
MTATYTWDVSSTLDGYGSYGPDGDWGGYWGKRGPEFVDHLRSQFEHEIRTFDRHTQLLVYRPTLH